MNEPTRTPRVDPWLFATLAVWGGYFAWLWPRMLVLRGDGLYAGWRLVWADWSFHFAYANVFAERPPAEWLARHPLFAGAPFGYPFVADAISGLLMRAGAGRVPAFLVPSLLTTLVLVVLLYLFYRARLGSGAQGFFATCLFFASGGLGFLRLFSEPGAPDLTTDLPDAGVVWINIVASELLPQRALLLGVTLGLAVLLTLHRWGRAGLASVPRARLAALGALTGALLLVHVHTWLSLAAVCAVLAATDRRNVRGWCWLAAGAAPVSVALLATVYRGVGTSTFLAWQPGWLAGTVGVDPPALPMFLWLNWGLFLPLAGIGAALFLRRDPMVLAGFALFAAALLVRFQPHAWDNTKVLTWAHLLLCLPIARLLAQTWGWRTTAGRVLAAVLFFVTTLSGALDLARLARPSGLEVRMFDASDLVLAERFRSLSRPDALVLAADHHHHWVSSLAGRPVVMAYRGWLYAYGIDVAPTERDVRAMFLGGPDAERLLERYGVQFVVIGPHERADFRADEGSFRSRYPVVLAEGETRVYAVGDAGAEGSPEKTNARDRSDAAPGGSD